MRPELPDVVNLKQFHRPPFESKTESPAHLLFNIELASLHHVVVDDSAPQNLEPLIVVENFQLEARLCKREVVLTPLHLNITENLAGQLLQHLL